jgi:RNA recognition motif-containing protein
MLSEMVLTCICPNFQRNFPILQSSAFVEFLTTESAQKALEMRTMKINNDTVQIEEKRERKGPHTKNRNAGGDRKQGNKPQAAPQQKAQPSQPRSQPRMSK